MPKTIPSPLAIATGAALLLGAAGEAAARPVLVELFTSQGCSSCPPADALLNTLADRDDVIALSFNITYWDYLGWRDTLGREEHTERQRAYARYFHDRNYTPQMVIDGMDHMAGSRTAAATRAIEERRGEVAGVETLEAEPSESGVTISAPAQGDGMAAVWIAHFDTSHEVEITRGENAGETITYSNVVRDLMRLGDWDMSAPLEIEIARETLLEGGHDGTAIIVQASDVGPVIGVTRLDVSDLAPAP